MAWRQTLFIPKGNDMEHVSNEPATAAMKVAAREAVAPYSHRRLIPVPVAYEHGTVEYRDGYVAWLCGHAREDNPYMPGGIPSGYQESATAWFAGYDDARAKVPNPTTAQAEMGHAMLTNGIPNATGSQTIVDHPAGNAGTTHDRPDVRDAVIIPPHVQGSAECDAYRDGVAARLDGASIDKCPYPPRDPAMNPPDGLAGAWSDGYLRAKIGVRRVGDGKQAAGKAVGKFTYARPELATHTIDVGALCMAMRGAPVVGVVPMAPVVYGPSVLERVNPNAVRPSSRVSMPPEDYEAATPERQRYDALARAHEHALRALQSHGFTRDGDEWRLQGAKVVSDAAARITDAEREAAVRTVKANGYTYHGGAEWKPPIGKPGAGR